MANPDPESKTPSGTPAAQPSSPEGSKISIVFLILPLLNLVVAAGSFGFLYYTKLKYKRPAITEETERARLQAKHTIKTKRGEPGTVDFEAMTVNIKSNPEHPRSADGTSQQLQGKLHYVTLAFSIEIKNKLQSDLIEAAKPAITDKILQLVGKKHFHELATVQGRYNVRSQLMEFANKLIASSNPEAPLDDLVTNIYFSQFIVQ